MFVTLRNFGTRISLHAVSLVILILSVLLALQRFSPSSRIHNHCQALQKTGWWVDPKALVWQPQGCTLKQYTGNDLRKCLGNSHMVFIGDSSVRTKFYAAARLIDSNFTAPTVAHADIDAKWLNGDVAARFIWDPYLNTSATQQQLFSKQLPPTTMAQPKILVLGSGSWYLRYKQGSSGIEQWQKIIDQLSTVLKTTTAAQHVYVNPVSNVVPALLSTERRETLKLNEIDIMNKYMGTVDLPVFESWNMMTRDLAAETTDGLHYSNRLEDRALNVLLNRVCNQETLSNTPPFRTTCCFAYPRPNWLVIIFTFATTVGLPMLIFATARHFSRGPSLDTLRQLLIFALILLTMYVCDRTPLFDKLQKHYVGWVFAVLIGLALLSGALTWEQDKAGGFLGRAQTDEWKGWMQLVILIYHLMNASTVSGIYNPVRVLVAMYLFMTGYGHCFYFHKKADFGIKRMTSVLLRTNILAVCLAYVMGTSYMDYYFAPLSSIWVLIVWLTMRVVPSANRTNWVWAKLLASMAVLKTINEWHLWPIGALNKLGIGWSQREWEFRFGTDIFIVYVGMAIALVVLHHGDQLQAHSRWPQIKRWAILLSLLSILWYFVFELSQNKFAYNRYHPYVSAVPVLGFIVLRNSTEYLRSHTSRVFKLMGGISLELFIAQFHLFLAADTKGILVLVDSRLWFINLLCTSVVFVGMCQLLGKASGIICGWLMAPISGQEKGGGHGEIIPMTEIRGHGVAALDRLASESPAARLKQLVQGTAWWDHLAVRWAVALVVLDVLNWVY
ncbi:10 TM acyl transferase domain found in Cas1p-domain-containing protein [Coemansia spiralis]|nr:10 TM acyl transferase domain found in Cas1p-domain-containing protein [Coemansia spiralis]